MMQEIAVRRKGESAFDAWTLVHLASGAGLGFARLPWSVAVGLIVGFEVVEAVLRQVQTQEGGLFEYESWPNIAVDIAVGVAGYAIAR